LRTPAILVACLALAAATLARAAAPALSASDAWVRVTPGAEVAAAYLTLHNSGGAPVSVVGVRCPLASMAMIHETRLNGTQTSMRPREELVVGPGETVRLAPGGLHVMLHEISQALKPGDEVPLVLLLKGGATLAVTAHVRPLSAE
jgi:periplasmic copper chaperone A